jgi:hypothetical protein
MPTRQRSRPASKPTPPILTDTVKTTLGNESAPALPEATFQGEQLPHRSREARIAELAYQNAEKRGFTPGFELDDWLAAERVIDGLGSEPQDDASDHLSL